MRNIGRRLLLQKNGTVRNEKETRGTFELKERVHFKSE